MAGRLSQETLDFRIRVYEAMKERGEMSAGDLSEVLFPGLAHGKNYARIYRAQLALAQQGLLVRPGMYANFYRPLNIDLTDPAAIEGWLAR